MRPRVATLDDLDGVTETLWEAFRDDPLWHWAFPDHNRLRTWWRFYIESALRYPWVWVVDDYAAASVWIPPDGTELTEKEEKRVEPLLEDLLGSRARAVMELVERFDDSHPRSKPHFYLSLLGTHPRHRGQGLGMELLAENLSTIDAEGGAAYLESSNPQNDRRYERLGFIRLGEFSTPDERHRVATMWRDPR
jgi:GNAT superfamily N-acetyltransferase